MGRCSQADRMVRASEAKLLHYRDHRLGKLRNAPDAQEFNVGCGNPGVQRIDSRTPVRSMSTLPHHVSDRVGDASGL